MPTHDTPLEKPGRKHPPHGVLASSHQPTIIFLTVCTKNRSPWLAQQPVHQALQEIWKTSETWLVGDYLLMPDHIHLFCAPRDLTVPLGRWVGYWKRAFSCLHLAKAGAWQRDYWDTRLRQGENYAQKWVYVRENPVRAGLVKNPDEWRYQGRIHFLPW